MGRASATEVPGVVGLEPLLQSTFCNCFLSATYPGISVVVEELLVESTEVGLVIQVAKSATQGRLSRYILGDF